MSETKMWWYIIIIGVIAYTTWGHSICAILLAAFVTEQLNGEKTS